MPIRFDLKRGYSSFSDRVKAIDIHPTEPWILVALYSGQINIHNFETSSIVKSFETNQTPVRAASFITRKNWVVSGSDDLMIRIFNYNTLEKVHSFEAHVDYIRHICVHPTKNLIISCGDDMTIKVWDWDKRFECVQVLEGHSHYVMQVAINPKDNTQIASASLDKKIKIWNIGTIIKANYTLEGHDKGVNGVDYCHHPDKPYLISSADDWSLKVWDYLNKSCIHTLSGHGNNVLRAIFHPNLPLIFSLSEDNSVKVWNISTFRCENTLNYGMGRVWCISAKKDSNEIALGFDDGCLMIKVGKEGATCCLDSVGKLFTCKQNNILQGNIKNVEKELRDDEKVQLAYKQMGSCEIYPQFISCSGNDRFISVVGDGEFALYGAIGFRSKVLGTGDRFAWSDDSNSFAVRDGMSLVLYKNFKIYKTVTTLHSIDELFGGPLLGVKTETETYFYEWNELNLIIKIDVSATNIIWNNTATLCGIVESSSFNVLKYDSPSPDRLLSVSEYGLPDVFEVLDIINESVSSGIFVMDCFIFVNKVNRLSYLIGNKVFTIRHLDRPYQIIGFVSSCNRLILVEKDNQVVTYRIDTNLIQYEIAIINKQFDAAEKILPLIPQSSLYQLGIFLENQELYDLALQVTPDLDHKFELALRINHLDLAHEICVKLDAENHYKVLSRTCISACRFDIAYECYKKLNDYNALFLLSVTLNNADILDETLEIAKIHNAVPVIFMIYYITGRVEECTQLLHDHSMLSEANLMSYCYNKEPLRVTFENWIQNLKTTHHKYAESLADPAKYPNLFADLNN